MDDLPTARQFLEAVDETRRSWEWRFHFSRLDQSVAVAELSDTIAAAAFNSDGSEIVTVTNAGLVQRWDPYLAELRSMQLDKAISGPAVFSAAARLAAVVGADRNTVAVWDTATGERLAEQSLGEGNISHVALSPHGEYLAMASTDDGLYLCDLTEGPAPVRIHDGAVRALAMSRDGRHLIAGFYISNMPSPVIVFDCATGAPTGLQYAHDKHPRLVVLSDDVTRLALADTDKAVVLSDFQDTQLLDRHTGSVTSVAMDPGGRYLLSGSSDQTVRLWDTDSGEQVGLFVGHHDPIAYVAFHPFGGRLMAVAGRSVRLWSTDANVSPTLLSGHTSYVYGVAFTANGSRVVSGGWDETFRIWDATTGECLFVVDPNAGRLFDVDATDTLIATAHIVGVRIWNAQTSEHITDLDPAGSERVIEVRFTPDSSRIAVRTRDTVSIWDPRSGVLIVEREVALEHSWDAFESAVTISRDGARFSVEDADNTISIRNAATGAELLRLHGHSNIVSCLAFSADGSRLASGSRDDSVRLWDAESGELLAVLEGHHDDVYAVAFSPDGTRLASGSNDNTIRLWDIASYDQVALIKGHSDYVYALAFSPDGSRLVSGSGDNTARIWDTVPVYQRWMERGQQ